MEKTTNLSIIEKCKVEGDLTCAKSKLLYVTIKLFSNQIKSNVIYLVMLSYTLSVFTLKV